MYSCSDKNSRSSISRLRDEAQMPFYQLVAITAHYDKYAPLRNLLSSTASYVRSKGGCVRAFNFYGARQLAQTMRNRKAERRIEIRGE